MKVICTCLLAFIVNTALAQKHSLLGIQVAREELKSALKLQNKKPVSWVGKLVNDKQTAVSLAELYLCKIYGKDQIISERPYEIYLIDRYWVLNGTLPVKSDGGGFIIIIDSNNGAIIKLSHYK